MIFSLLKFSLILFNRFATNDEQVVACSTWRRIHQTHVNSTKNDIFHTEWASQQRWEQRPTKNNTNSESFGQELIMDYKSKVKNDGLKNKENTGAKVENFIRNMPKPHKMIWKMHYLLYGGHRGFQPVKPMKNEIDPTEVFSKTSIKRYTL